MATILVIENDQNILTGLVDNLKMEGHQTLTAIDGKAGYQLATEAHPDLIVLDIMMPGMDGFEVCKRLRENRIPTPIVILSARSQESDKVLGLELGADDYVSKPFSPLELMMRIKAVLRRALAPEPTVVTVGKLSFDFPKYKVARDGKEVELTPNEFTILKLLVQQMGEPVSRHKILSVIWGKSVTSRTVDTHIWNLREKLEDDPPRPAHIVTVQRIGYKFVP